MNKIEDIKTQGEAFWNQNLRQVDFEANHKHKCWGLQAFCPSQRWQEGLAQGVPRHTRQCGHCLLSEQAGAAGWEGA